MSNLIKNASNELREIIISALGRLVEKGDVPAEPISDLE